MERTEQYIDSLLNTIRTSLPNFAKQTLSDALRDQAADAQATIAALEAEVKDLKEWLGAYKQSIELAQSEITQRTAELEAANEKVQFLEKKNSNLLDSSNTVLKVKADQDVRLASLQAELERVRGEVRSVGYETVKELCEGFMNVMNQRQELRDLILALPKVEGEIYAQRSEGLWYVWHVTPHGSQVMCGRFRRQEEAQSYVDLWQHRQGMEGCP